jgi:hypothetical protein
MEPKEFIQQRLNELKLVNKPESVPREKLAGFIYSSLTSKKFRKYKIVPEEYADQVKGAIESSIQYNHPIKIVWPFGG